MKDDIDNNEKLFNEFLNLRNYSNNLTRLYTHLMSKNFNYEDWKKERKNIDSDMNRYSKSLEKIEELLHSVNENNNKSKEEIKKIKEQVKTIKNECEPKYKQMEARIENFKEMNDGDKEEEEENKDEQITDLINSKETKKEIQKQLDEIKKISPQINDFKEDLDRRIANENEVLEDKEKPLIDDEKNEEKIEDKKQERNDNKKRCLGIEWTRNKIIVTALIAIVIIAVVVVIIVFCSK